MTTRLFLSNGLPPRIVDQATRAFRQLDCCEESVEALVDIVGALAAAQGFADPLAIQNIFLLLVAANHSRARLSEPSSPFRTDVSAGLPTTTEWLLLAARECSLTPIPSPLGKTFAEIIVELDATVATNGNSPPSPISDYGCGAFAAAVMTETNAEHAFAGGHALGKLTRITLEIMLACRSSTPLFAPVLLQSIFALEPELAAHLRLAVAMACKPVPDKLALMSFLGRSEVRSRLSATCATWFDDASRAMDCLGTNVRTAFSQATLEAVERKTKSLAFFGLAKPPSLAKELDRSIDLAVAALLDDPDLRESWEVQRWGGPFPRTCVARVFPVGLCMLALATASIDISSTTRALLSLRCVDGYRYFEGFDGIPPDTDLLGIVLQLVSRIPFDAELATSLVWPVELIVKNTHADGEIPVWLEQHLREPTPKDAPHWQGARCLAVAANCVIGLLEAGVAVPEGFVDRAVGWIVRTWRKDGMRAVFFYDLPYTQLVLARLLEVGAPRLQDPSVHDELEAIVNDAEASILASRQWDGGFGSVLQTACNLAVLSIRTISPFDPWPTIAFLASRQTHDGLWSAEPLYPVPGKDHAPAAHGARPITTALCLYALARARDRLRRNALA